jgi:23S rRNA (uracil1939-C5)-methyltransferase
MENIIHYLSIEKVAMHGYGIGYHEGKTVFVPFTMPGDCVNVQIRIEKSKVIFGTVLEYIDASELGIIPACDAFGGEHPCGGCDWLMAPYRTQVYWKTELIKEVFGQLGCAELVGKTVGSPQTQFYRNKSFLPVGMVSETPDRMQGDEYPPAQQMDIYAAKQKQISFGMFERYSHSVIPHRQCLLQPPVMDAILNEIMAFAHTVKLEAYDEASHNGVLRHVGIRTNQAGDEIVIILVTRTARFPFTNQLVRNLTTSFPAIVGIIQNINRNVGNVIMGTEDKLLYGTAYLHESIGQTRYRIHYQSFFQINAGTTALLYKHLLSCLSPEDCVLDAYCGIGSIGLFIAPAVKHVVGIEEFAPAIADAEYNQHLNGISNAVFQIGKVEDILPAMMEQHSFTTVILDPPRKGVERSALEALVKHQIPQIIYVSCNPMTVARDIRILLENGYTVCDIQPFDMFPQTWHIETVVRLQLAP